MIAILLFLAANLTGLARLAANHFVRVFNAFALIGFWLANGATLRGNLADRLLIDARDTQPRRSLDSKRDARRWVELHRMGVTNLEDQIIAYLGNAIANAVDLQVLREPLCYTS